jgi:mannose-6-phosphate isomerase-like protein (cupin superfamily)
MSGKTTKENLPAIVTLSAEARDKGVYENHPIAHVNDHVIRISVMTQPYHRHCHPNSDEVFLVIEGGLIIEFESGGVIQLAPGQMVTVARGVRHRTHPLDGRSVESHFRSCQ